jgi:hypothetical protein
MPIINASLAREVSALFYTENYVGSSPTRGTTFLTKMKTLKELVSNDAKVHFQFYRKGELWYKTACGFEFPVPVSDTGDGTFLNEDRAMIFMRYIRKQLEAIKEGQLG